MSREEKPSLQPVYGSGMGVGGASLRRVSRYGPVSGVLVQLAKLPVDREDVHVVVLLEIPSQQVQRVVARLQALLILVDLLYLKH